MFSQERGPHGLQSCVFWSKNTERLKNISQHLPDMHSQGVPNQMEATKPKIPSDQCGILSVPFGFGDAVLLLCDAEWDVSVFNVTGSRITWEMGPWTHLWRTALTVLTGHGHPPMVDGALPSAP